MSNTNKMSPKEKAKDYRLRRYYGITLDDYNSLLRKQHNACYICLRSSSVFKRGLAVDHDHKTGSIRGLLCPWCNRGLRYFHDNADSLRRAARHIARDPLKKKVPKKYLKGIPKRRKRKAQRREKK